MFPDPGSKNRSVKLFFSPPLPVSLFRSGGFSPALQVAPDLLFFSKIAASLAPHWPFFLSAVSIPLQFCITQPGYTPCPDFPTGDSGFWLCQLSLPVIPENGLSFGSQPIYPQAAAYLSAFHPVYGSSFFVSP